MRTPSLSDQSLYALAVFYVCAVALTLAAGAPAPKTPPAPDHETGVYARRLDSPVVLVAGEGGQETVYWLVFPDQAREGEAMANIDYGDRVTVRGRRGTGGAYRYFVPSAIEKAD